MNPVSARTYRSYLREMRGASGFRFRLLGFFALMLSVFLRSGLVEGAIALSTSLLAVSTLGYWFWRRGAER